MSSIISSEGIPQEISTTYETPTWSWVLRELYGLYKDQTSDQPKAVFLKMIAEVLALKGQSEKKSA